MDLERARERERQRERERERDLKHIACAHSFFFEDILVENLHAELFTCFRVLYQLYLAERALAELLNDLVLVDVFGAIIVLAQRHIRRVHEILGDVAWAAPKLPCVSTPIRERKH